MAGRDKKRRVMLTTGLTFRQNHALRYYFNTFFTEFQ